MMRLIVVTALFVVANAAIDKDLVTSLPGWNGTLPSKHYSGYLPVGKPNVLGYLHYWFIEAESYPANKPVALWLNGGPGSSSLIGLLTENGQFQTNDDSLDAQGNVNLIYNPYSWSQVANMLYLEQPKGVGFSYCAQGVRCVNNDTSVGVEAADFFEAFFAGFPEYAKNDFYITGESYAGIYIPEIMAELDRRGTINLKGAAIGDGCWGNEVGTCGFAAQSDRIDAEFLYGMAMYSQPLYTQIKAACGNFSTESAACRRLINQMNTQIGDFDIYNVFDTCGNDQVTLQDIRTRLRDTKTFTTQGSQAFKVHPQLHAGVGGALNDYVCGAMTVMDQWLNQADVQAALHVDHSGSQSYSRTAADLRDLYKSLAQKYRILIYSGSVDACVPYWGSEEWTRELGFPVTEDWKPWYTPARDTKAGSVLGGYVIKYAATDTLPFYFLTVRGAGHLVPQHQPIAALTMLSKFLSNQPF